MNKKGFTLIELLSTIFVLGIVLTIAISSTIGIYKLIKRKALDEKIALMEESAILFGENRKENIIKSTSIYKDVPCKSFKLRELVPNYIENDTNNECINSENGKETGCIVDPSDKDNYLDETEVIIYYQNKRIYSVVDINDELVCETTKFTPKVKEFYLEDGNTFVVNHKNVSARISWEAENIKYYCITDRENSESCMWNDTTNKSVTTDYTLSNGDGKKVLYAFIKDKYENLSEGKSYEITLDTSAPTSNSVKINNDAAYTTSTNVTLTLSSTGAKEMCISNTSSCTNWITYATSKSWTLSSGDGTKTVYVWYRDEYGNTSEYVTDTITIDTSAPTNNSVKINNDAASTTSVNVTLTLSSSGASQMCISNTTSCTNWVTYTTSKSHTLTTGDGTKTVYVWYKDAAGNTTSTYVTDTIKLDTSVPTNNSVKINSNATYTTSTGVTLTLSSSGAKEMCISNTSSCTNWITYATSKSWTLSSGDGTKTVYVWYRGESGETSSYVTDTIILDTQAPTSNSIKINSNATYTTSTSVTLTLASSGANQMCISNTTSCSSWVTYSTSKSWTLNNSTNGTKTVYAWFKDAAGNQTSSYVSDSIILDTVYPTVTASAVNNNTAAPKISINSNEAGTYCVNTNSTRTNFSNCVASGSISANSAITTSALSTNTYYVHVKDGAGNIGVSSMISITTANPFGQYLISKKTLGFNSTMEGGLYRYQGAHGSVNNYVCFGTSNKNTCLSNTDAYMYRVIGVNSSGQAKILKNEALNSAMSWNTTIGNYTWPNTSLYAAINGSSFLTNTTYVPSGWSGKIATSSWKYGDTYYANLDMSASSIYSMENGWTSAVSAKIGLMYVHDYYYAYQSGGLNCSMYGSYSTCRNAWIHLGNRDASPPIIYMWFLSRLGYLGDHDNYAANDVGNEGYVYSYYLPSQEAVCPVFYLTTSVNYISGTGTASDPFIIN